MSKTLSKRIAEERASYAGRIADIRAEFEAVNKELSRAMEGLDLARDSKTALDAEIARLGDRKGVLQSDIARIEGEKAAHERISTASAGASSETLAGLEKAIAERRVELSRADEDTKRSKERAKSFEEKEAKLVDRVGYLMSDVKQLESRKSDLEKKAQARDAALAKRERDVAKRENDADDKIARASRTATEAERTRGKVELWAKRLQRRYDKEGIRIDLLGQLGISRDSVEVKRGKQ